EYEARATLDRNPLLGPRPGRSPGCAQRLPISSAFSSLPVCGLRVGMESGGGICRAALLGACGLLRRRCLRSGRLFQGWDTPLAGASAWLAVSGLICCADRLCGIPVARAGF